ncbi:hypothetical protein [Corallococcus sp. CA054B]|uniref:hypothetical protein n=1 Tax=Corallococcus sp. CA054B TaxID=2316734 RepID=UPI0011C34B56|nr:hypothetical protein [Corallococcus sp. CA054B]
MRVAIIAGLMAVGVLAGCGREDSNQDAQGILATREAALPSASECEDTCEQLRVACLDTAENSAQRMVCQRDWLACNEGCASSNAAMAPPDSCDPFEDDGWCPVSSNKITCFNGVQMDAHWTPDGWCINADVCKNYGGPWGCPEW